MFDHANTYQDGPRTQLLYQVELYTIITQMYCGAGALSIEDKSKVVALGIRIIKAPSDTTKQMKVFHHDTSARSRRVVSFLSSPVSTAFLRTKGTIRRSCRKLLRHLEADHIIS